jgi:hypothetical protein
LGISSSFVANCNVVHVCRLAGDEQTVILSVQTVRPSTVLRPRAYPVSPTLGLRLQRLVEVLGANSRLGSLNPGFLVLRKAMTLDDGYLYEHAAGCGRTSNEEVKQAVIYRGKDRLATASA